MTDNELEEFPDVLQRGTCKCLFIYLFIYFMQGLAATYPKQMSTSSWGSPNGNNADEEAGSDLSFLSCISILNIKCLETRWMLSSCFKQKQRHLVVFFSTDHIRVSRIIDASSVFGFCV